MVIPQDNCKTLVLWCKTCVLGSPFYTFKNSIRIESKRPPCSQPLALVSRVYEVSSEDKEVKKVTSWLAAQYNLTNQLMTWADQCHPVHPDYTRTPGYIIATTPRYMPANNQCWALTIMPNQVLHRRCKSPHFEQMYLSWPEIDTLYHIYAGVG